MNVSVTYDGWNHKWKVSCGGAVVGNFYKHHGEWWTSFGGGPFGSRSDAVAAILKDAAR